MRLKLKSFSLCAGVSAMLLAGAAVARAHQFTLSPQRTPMSTAAPQGAQVSAMTLARFKKAYWSVQSIQKEYAAKLEHAHSDKAAQTLRQWVQGQIATAVKGAGLTMRKYDNVMMLMQREPALRKQVLGH